MLGSSGEGAAWVYVGSATGVVSVAEEELTAAGAEGRFGASVAGRGDNNGDGLADLLVGAPGAESNQGAVYLYVGETGGGGCATSPPAPQMLAILLGLVSLGRARVRAAVGIQGVK